MRPTGQRHPATKARPLLKPLFTGTRALKYNLLAGIWFAFSVWFWVWWLDPSHVIGLGRYLLITAGLIWAWSMQLFFVQVFLNAHVSAAPDPVPGQFRVAMIVTKAPSEPFDVARRTLEAMLAQTYPHDTWLADEDPTPEVITWCRDHGVLLSSRKGVEEYHRQTWPRRTRCKEGNLAYFYDNWGYKDYDIVAQLDVDHVPQPGYLVEILRPFADPEVGYVSAPSICASNAKEHWTARTRLFSEAGFHGVFQAGYSKLLTPMCIGSHYAVRTQALKQAGGLGPELAEDHSTTMLISAAGWRGVHAIDAIAVGDGPASLPDLVTQEFQWSRSLMTLLLRYTPSYFGRLPFRLKLLFGFCQIWYALFSLAMAVMYLAPIIAVVYDVRFADVTYPEFIVHIFPIGFVPLLFVIVMKRDHLLRPVDAKIIAWEKILFVALQWPWVLWGVTMAIRDRITGNFVDFRITPKGDTASNDLPNRVVLLYAVLALGAIVPVITQDNLTEARGFYLLALMNAIAYVAILAVAVIHHLRHRRAKRVKPSGKMVFQVCSLTLIMALFVSAITIRAEVGLHALAYGLQPLQITKVEYIVAGAGQGEPGDFRVIFDLGWIGFDNSERRNP
ncbi:cellulose synthase (UDP-forming) [Shimia gijangensis]|uniref:Cellulose synthase (UDP-forming) n=1 Tax=Shimia gijangensis TaxID=1470563 RepID=A0A1M6D9H3_9RHOB|nr:glycosyltransferase [Shimia gijangensis]SHI69872.1 cellulose synthase (UDP-forming) [Shimia gijangensis]